MYDFSAIGAAIREQLIYESQPSAMDAGFIGSSFFKIIVGSTEK